MRNDGRLETCKCDHDRASHFEGSERKEESAVPKFVLVRLACLVRGCECPRYVPRP